MRLVQPMPQKELPTSSLRLFVGFSPGLLIGVESLERLNAGVERAVLTRLAACRTVPAAVVELLIKDIGDQVRETLSFVTVSSRKAHQHRGDAGLWDPPCALPLPEAPTRCQRRWISR
jgi:hypothetical protein